MNQELLQPFEDVIESSTSIKHHVDRIAELWDRYRDQLSDSEQEYLVNEIRNKVQEEGLQSLYGSDNQALYIATGVGKSKIAIMYIAGLVYSRQSAKILIVVPTEKLRDSGWPDEFRKWGADNYYHNNVMVTCYASIAKLENCKFDLVVMDEGHNITENNTQFFNKNEVGKIIMLTATKPTDMMKKELLRELGIIPAFTLSLEEATKLGIVAPYTITVVTMNSDNVEKYIKAGSAKKGYFYNTEKNQYAYLSTGRMLFTPLGHINRMRFVYNMKSKVKAAKWILDNVIPQDLRTLIFCGSKDHANQLCDYRYYSKPQPPKKLGEKATEAKKAKYQADLHKYNAALPYYQGNESLDLFVEGKINRLASVEALNEGQNIPGLDVGFIVQLNSSDKDFIQRTGRIIRYRPGHTGKIIILCAIDTVDKKWVDKALSGAKITKVEWIELSRLQAGIETITF